MVRLISLATVEMVLGSPRKVLVVRFVPASRYGPAAAVWPSRGVLRAANALAFTSLNLPSCLPASYTELPGSSCIVTVPMVWFCSLAFSEARCSLELRPQK